MAAEMEAGERRWRGAAAGQAPRGGCAAAHATCAMHITYAQFGEFLRLGRCLLVEKSSKFSNYLGIQTLCDEFVVTMTGRLAISSALLHSHIQVS